MVLFGLTLIVLKSGAGNTAVSLLVLSFLAPGGAVLRRRRRLRRPAGQTPRPRRHQRPAGGAARAAVARRIEPAAPAAHQPRDLDGHGVLRARRGVDDPAARPAATAAVGERRVHLDAQRRVRHRLRGRRARGRRTRRGARADPRRGGVLPRRRGLLLDAAAVAARGPGARRREPPPAGDGGGDGLDLRAAPRGGRVHPRQPVHRLVAAVPRHRRIAGRRAGGAGTAVRAGLAGPAARGLRRRGAAARVRDRDRDPDPQLVRPSRAPPAADRGGPRGARDLRLADRARRPDQPGDLRCRGQRPASGRCRR